MKGSVLTSLCLLMAGLVLSAAVTDIQRCLGSKNVMLCMDCCSQLSGQQKSECEGRCPDLTRAWQLLLTCTDNPSTCFTCCVRALTVLSYRPDLLNQCTTSCRNAMLLGTLG